MSHPKLRNSLEDYCFPKEYLSTSKENVLDFLLNYNPDTSGYLTRKIGFKKFFPELYNEFKQIVFPLECDLWTFTQKLYHFLHNDLDLHLGICNECKINRCKFINFKNGYKQFCCSHCSSINEKTLQFKNQTIINKYGSFEEYNIARLKNTIKTNQKNHNVDIWTNRNKAENTFNNKYGCKSYMNTKDFREKSKAYYQKHYGCDTNSQIPGWVDIYSKSFKDGAIKSYKTKKKNGTLTSSSVECKLKEKLKELNIKYIHQYKSEEYPFACDFYLQEYNLYIEIQGHWSHGKHQFNEHNQKDINILNKWKEKNSEQYKHAIEVWTHRDPLKRETAKNNNLNYLEIFSINVDECLNQIITKIKELE